MRNIDSRLRDGFVPQPEQPVAWYKNNAVQTVIATVVFIVMSSIIMGLTALFFERLSVYFDNKRVITIKITASTLLTPAKRLRDTASLLPTDDRNRALELAHNLEQATKELKGPQRLVLKYAKKEAPKWLKVAIHENNRQYRLKMQYNNRIFEYIAVVDPNVVRELPKAPIYWSSHFLNWAMRKVWKAGTKSADPKSWLNWGRGLTEPKLGAVAVFSMRKQKNFAYVGFFLLETTNYIIVIGGDIGSAVNIAAFAKQDLLGYRWYN